MIPLLTKYWQILDIFDAEFSSAIVILSVLDQIFYFFSEIFHGDRIVDDVVHDPEGQSQGVVVDMEVDQVVSDDIRLTLTIILHYLGNDLDVFAGIWTCDHFVRGWLLDQFQ